MQEEQNLDILNSIKSSKDIFLTSVCFHHEVPCFFPANIIYTPQKQGRWKKTNICETIYVKYTCVMTITEEP